MKRYADWKIRAKIFLMVGITVVVLVSALLGYFVWYLVTKGQSDATAFGEDEMAKVKANLVSFVDIAYETIESSHVNSTDRRYLEGKYGYRLKYIIDVAGSTIAHHRKNAASGEISEVEAQELAMEQIKGMRYDEGTGYIWINDTGKPYPRMIMHPTVPNLDGKILDAPNYNVALGIGQNLFQAFVEVCERDGEGFVDYLWPKPTRDGLTEDQPKLSYVRLIEGWNWIIGTGIYIDDAISDAKQETRQAIKQMRYAEDKSGYFWINDTGEPFPEMVMHPTVPELDGKILDDPKYNCAYGTDKNLFQAFVEVCKENGEGFVDYLWPKPTEDGLTEDQPKMSYVRLFEPWNWIIGTGVYVDDIGQVIDRKEAALKRDIIRAIAVSSGIAVILIVGSFLILGWSLKAVTSPISNIVEWSNVLAEGNLAQRIEYSSENEIGLLSRNLNKAVSSLSNLTINIKRASDRNLEVRQDLSASTDETLTSATEIAANAESIGQQLGNLDSQINTSATAVTQISANIAVLNEQIEAQASAVSESSASVEQMLASLRSTTGITKNIKGATDRLVETARIGGDKLSTTTDGIQQIAGSVDDILSMISVINNVASQTNLLSMNAAIEAAHAGEFGRGFAVVADEIRKLAESTAENAKQISGALREIVEHIKRASESSRETSDSFESINREIKEVASALTEISFTTEELSTGGDEILKAMTSLNDISTRVREGSNEMKRGAEDMGNSQEDVRNISAIVVNGMSEIAEGTKQITKAMLNVSEITTLLGQGAEELNEEVNKFITD